MPRLRSAQGVVVNVSDEKAARLGSSWVTVDESPEDKPAPRKRSAKSDSSK